MGLFKRWRAKRAAKKQLKAEQKAQQEEKATTTVKQPVEQTKPEETKTAKAEPREENAAEPNVEEKARILKYHVSQNKDKKSSYFKQWRVRKEGSKKTIKYHNTQKEAIEHAEELAEKAGSSVVIHKVDGTIRKQNYND